MKKRIRIKNHQEEIQLTTKRAIIALIVMAILILFLVFRLFYLQIYHHHTYQTLSTKNWLDLVPSEPSRGLIYDRNGILLAENIPVFSLDVIPSQVSDMNKSLSALAKIVTLNNHEITLFKKQIRQHRRHDEIPLKLRLSEAEVARFTENQHRFPGIFVKARLIRYYPYGKRFSHLIGYVGRINAHELKEIDPVNYSASHYIGKVGIEKFYEDELHGKVGYQEVENDANGKPVRILNEIKGTPGKNIYLTIDSKLQAIAEAALEGHRGAIVAIEPASGQILAMFSSPGYDPNAFVAGISQKDYQQLQQASDRPLFNRALRGLYPMASTVKPFYALEGLASGIIDTDYAIEDPGWFLLPHYSRPYRDWRRHGHGIVDVRKAIISSCDTFFYELATKMGIKRMGKVLQSFGFGSATGIDLEDELAGNVPSPEWKRRVKGSPWYEGDTVISGIGQGYIQTTPLQLAVATATLANRGQRFIPYLLLAEQTPGMEWQRQSPIPLESLAEYYQDYWEPVISAMQGVINSVQGTAYRYGRQHQYSIAAKTGTAQIISSRSHPDEEDKQENLPEKFRDHHLFIAFAPVDRPRIAVAIVTENGYYTIEIARAIFNHYLGTPAYAARSTETEINTSKLSSQL